MSAAARALPSRGGRLLPALIAILPFVVFVAARLLGVMSLLRLAVLGLVAGIGALVLLVRPRWGLLGLMFYIYSGIGNFVPAPVAMPVTFLAVASVLLGIMRGERWRFSDPVFWWASAFFLLMSFQSMLFAREPMLCVIELVNFCKMVLVLFLVVQLTQSAHDLRRLGNAIVLGSLGSIVLGLLALRYGIGPGQEAMVGIENTLRFNGGHTNPNFAAALTCSAIPFAIFGARNAGRTLARVFHAVALLALIVAVFATLSRSVIFPFGVIALAVMLREFRSRRAYLVLALLLVACILFTPRFYWDRVLGLRQALEGTPQDWSLYTRWLAMTTAIDLFQQHPLTGVGLGNFIVAGAYKLFVRIVVHNTYLEVLVGTGIFGLLAFMALLFSGARHAITGAWHRWQNQPPWARALSFYTGLAALSIGLSALFGTMTFRYPLWIPVAAGLVVGNLLQDEPPGSAA
jgi:O-antigen ligase